ncbi:MAG: hypothetical protein ACUVV6_05930 [Thermoplasmatota archaeon]
MGEQEQAQRKKRREEERLAFDPGKVFGPEEAKADDFKLESDRESARYKAQKGEGGDRRKEA